MSMHNEKFVACIKAAGKVLKEQKDQVFIPFGSEYSIYLKNLNSVRAVVRLTLDGVDVTDGVDLVIQPNSSIDLERFMKSGNLSQGNRFKFIERSGKVEAHRGVGAEDGLLRVEFQFEKPAVNWVDIYNEKKDKEVHHHHHYDYRRPYWYYDRPYWDPYWKPGCYGQTFMSTQDCMIGGSSSNSASAGVNYSADSYTLTTSGNISAGDVVKTAAVGSPLRSIASNNAGAESISVNHMNASLPVNDAGITVPGSISNQEFTTVSGFPLEAMKHVIVLKLLGEVGGKAIKTAVTVKRKQTCGTCGTRNRGANKCCRECGTSLSVI